MKKTIFLRALWLVLLLPALRPLLQSQTAVLSVQGVLRKNDGKAVDDGTYTLRFRLWKHPTSTNNADKVWEDTFSDVEIAGGVYSVLLGSGTQPLDAPFDQTYYLGVGMASGSELQPRPMLTSAPFVLSLQGQSNIIPSTGPIGFGTTRPDTTSAQVVIESATQGMLIPRMSLAQRNVISNPAAGLLIFQTNSNPGFYYYTGNTWLPIGSIEAPTLQLGQQYEGGFIIYLDDTGQHGLVAATSDITNSVSMGAGTTWSWHSDSEDQSGETRGVAIGSGRANTRSLMRKAQDKEDYRAAYVCHEYVSPSGHSDWFLPSANELNLMYTVLKANGIGGFSNAEYWSSSEDQDDNNAAWSINFTNGMMISGTKTSNRRVRPVRAF